MARIDLDTAARGLVVAVAIGAVVLGMAVYGVARRVLGWVATIPARLRNLDARLRASSNGSEARRLLRAADRAVYRACVLLERADRLTATARELGAFAPAIIPVATVAPESPVAVPVPVVVRDQSTVDTSHEIELPAVQPSTLYIRTHGWRYRAARPTDDGPRYRRTQGKGKRPSYQLA